MGAVKFTLADRGLAMIRTLSGRCIGYSLSAHSTRIEEELSLWLRVSILRVGGGGTRSLTADARKGQLRQTVTWTWMGLRSIGTR